MPTFKTYLHQSIHEIQQELTHVAKDLDKQIAHDFPELRQLHTRFTDSFFGGKMLRGTLVRLGYELLQQEPSHAIFKAAAAYEILHTSLLIHDDIIDKSPLRRGKPTLHRMEKNKHYGISQSLCLGDLGLMHACKLISESDFPSSRKQKALQFFLTTVTQTILGEMLDVHSAYISSRTEEQVLTIHRTKTAYYTIGGPLAVGALLGGASDSFVQTLEQFGEYLGIAFQIRDDILGVFGDKTAIGKSTTSDIEENKSTLLIIYSMKHATNEQKNILKRYYGKKGITQKEHEIIKQIFRDAGALAYSQNKIATYLSQAKVRIPSLTKSKDKQVLLSNLADFIAGN